MVHALREAHRVLKPNGLLLDLRPGPVHRRVGIEVDGQYRQVAIMNESLNDDYAANRAVTEVLQEGLFKSASRIQFNCNRTMTLKDFPIWLADFSTDRGALQERLVHTIERAFKSNGRRKKIVVKGPLVLKVLRKVGNSP
jgi:SAM-dependent methyltransferase